MRQHVARTCLHVHAGGSSQHRSGAQATSPAPPGTSGPTGLFDPQCVAITSHGAILVTEGSSNKVPSSVPPGPAHARVDGPVVTHTRFLVMPNAWAHTCMLMSACMRVFGQWHGSDQSPSQGAENLLGPMFRPRPCPASVETDAGGWHMASWEPGEATRCFIPLLCNCNSLMMP